MTVLLASEDAESLMTVVVVARSVGGQTRFAPAQTEIVGDPH